MSVVEPSLICRVCLRSDEKLLKKSVSIFNKLETTLIADNLNLIADLKIIEGDGLPEKICPECLVELLGAVSFIEKCETSNKLLQTTLLYRTKSIQYENTYYEISDSLLTKTKTEGTEVKDDPDEIDRTFDGDYISDNNESKIDITLNKVIIEESIPVIEKTKSTLTRESRAVDLKLECNECGGLFKSKCKLSIHWKKVHMLESLICNLCKRAFKTYKSYNTHKKQNCVITSKISIEGVGKSRVFHCKSCDYKSTNLQVIKVHLRIHTGARPFCCNVCNKHYSQLSGLNRHKDRKHNNNLKEMTCQVCGKNIKGKAKFHDHMARHKFTKVQCDLCEKWYGSKLSLITHLVRHSGIKSYTCEICARSFYSLPELHHHRKGIHEKGKYIFKCDICQYTAFSKYVISKHRAKHTGSNISCLQCGQFSENEIAYAKHQKRHISDRNYPCPYCEKKFMNSTQRSKHVTKVHKRKQLNYSHTKSKTESHADLSVIQQNGKKNSEIKI